MTGGIGFGLGRTISFLPDIVGKMPQGDNKDRYTHQDGDAGFDNGFFHTNRLEKLNEFPPL